MSACAVNTCTCVLIVCVCGCVQCMCVFVYVCMHCYVYVYVCVCFGYIYINLCEFLLKLILNTPVLGIFLERCVDITCHNMHFQPVS